MKKIDLRLKPGKAHYYPILIGSGQFRLALQDEIARLKPSKVAIVTDSNLYKLYGETLKSALAGMHPVILTFAAGEKNKNLSVIEKLFSGLVKNRLDRKSLIVAFGGGVTGDMAGFLASIYMRGIPFIQVPTSLLAMVDSSIGGKTGIDTPEAKNIMGRFHQPDSVIIDTLFLKTLNENEYRNGMAEVIKHAVIMNKHSFHLLESRPSVFLARSEMLLQEGMIYKSCTVKKKVVQSDEMEHGLRQILNFGHTAGHAIEQASGFKVPHGFAVGLGMAAESLLSNRRGLLPQNDLDRIIGVLRSYDLLKHAGILKKIKTENIVRAALSDKKNVGGKIRVVMIERIGKTHHRNGQYSFDFSEKELKEGLDFVKEIAGQ